MIVSHHTQDPAKWPKSNNADALTVPLLVRKFLLWSEYQFIPFVVKVTTADNSFFQNSHYQQRTGELGKYVICIIPFCNHLNIIKHYSVTSWIVLYACKRNLLYTQSVRCYNNAKFRTSLICQAVFEVLTCYMLYFLLYEIMTCVY